MPKPTICYYDVSNPRPKTSPSTDHFKYCISGLHWKRYTRQMRSGDETTRLVKLVSRAKALNGWSAIELCSSDLLTSSTVI